MGWRVDALHGVCGVRGWVGGLVRGGGGWDGGFGEASDEAGDGVGDGVGEIGACGVWMLLLLGGRRGGVWADGSVGLGSGRHTVELGFRSVDEW